MQNLLKKSVFLLFFVLTYGCTNQEQLFIGKWELEEIRDGAVVTKVKEFSSDFELSDNLYYLNFYENGRIEGYIWGRQITGTWRYNTKSKKILIEDEEEAPPYTLSIKEIAQEKILISGRENDRNVILLFLPKKSKK